MSLSLASLLRPVRLGKPYQEYKVPAGIARKVIEARKPPRPRKGGDIRGSLQHHWCFIPETVKTQSSAPENGRNYRPKHVEQIEVINKLSLLHLVDCLYYY